MEFKDVIAILFVITFIILVALAIFKPSVFQSSQSKTTTKTSNTTTSTPKKTTTTTTKPPSFPYSAIVDGTTTITPLTTSSAPTILSSPVPTITLAPTYTSNMTIWLDASSSSNWLDDTWVNNAPLKSSNATFIKGTWKSSNWVSDAMNGLPGISFTGYNALGTTDAAGTYNAGATIFVVFQPTAADTYKTLVSRTATNAYPAPFDFYNDKRLVGKGSALSFFSSGVNLNSLPLNTSYIFAFRVSNTSGTAYATEWLNGSIQYSNLKLTNYGDTASSVQIGTRGSKDTSFTGYMGEVMVYKTALSDTIVAEIHSHLSQKWGIPIITSYPETILACYARIQRADNQDQYVNIADIQMFDNSGAKLTTTGAWLSTSPYSEYPASNMIDDNPNTIGHTMDATDSWVQVGVGADKDIGKVVVINRQDCCGEREIGCSLTLFTLAGNMTYIGPPITINQGMYEFTFDTQNSLSVSYYGAKKLEIISLYVDSVLLVRETLTSSMTHSYKIGYKPSTISIGYNNDGTVAGDIYLTKLEYNGTDLISTYTNTSANIQSAVRNGLLAWEMIYTFTV